MAEKVRTDVLLKDFWRVNERFADLFNAVIFQGKEVLKAEELQEMDTDMSGIIRFREHEESLVRVRDVVKKMAFGVEFVVLGIDPCNREDHRFIKTDGTEQGRRNGKYVYSFKKIGRRMRTKRTQRRIKRRIERRT